jgi:hypothetical protein
MKDQYIHVELTEKELKKCLEYFGSSCDPRIFSTNKVSIKLSTFMMLFGNGFHDVKHWPHEIKVKKVKDKYKFENGTKYVDK